jgi:hypothetical protein
MKKSLVAVGIFCAFAIMPSPGFAADEGKALKCNPVTVELLRGDKNSAELLITSTPKLNYDIAVSYANHGKEIKKETATSIGTGNDAHKIELSTFDSKEVAKACYNITVTTQSKEANDTCANEHNTATDIKIWSPHNARFDAGSVISLNPDGSFQTKPEVNASFRSVWNDWLTGGTDLRYSNYGEIKKKDAAVTGKTTGTVSTTTDNAGQSTTTTTSTTITPKADTTQPKNPFESGGGTFRLNLYAYLTPFIQFPDWAFLRPVVGLGLTSVPSQNDGATTLSKQFYYYGIRLNIDEFSSTIGNSWVSRSNGFAQAGWLKNSAWEEALPTKYTSDRFFFEGELNVISITDANSLRLRLYVDIPQAGNDPSDIRISALWAIDPIKLGWFFHPAGSTQTAAAAKP